MSALTAGRMSYIGEEETGPSGDISEEKNVLYIPPSSHNEVRQRGCGGDAVIGVCLSYLFAAAGRLLMYMSSIDARYSSNAAGRPRTS